MKIEQIRQVMEIYRAGSINQAAQNLYLSQSTLSSSIHSVERELQQTIFRRSHRGIELTDFGHSFIRYGTEILAAHENILAAAPPADETCSGERLSVSVSHILFINRAFHRLYNKYHGKQVNFSYRNDSRDKIITDVAQGVCDLGVLAMPSIMKSQWLDFIHTYNMEYSVFSQEPAQVLFGPLCPLYNHPDKSVSLQDLQALNRITARKQHELFQRMDAALTEILHPGRCIQIDDEKLMASALLETDGYYLATMNQNAYREKPYDSDIRNLPLKDAPFSFEFGFIHKRGQPLSPVAKEFTELIYQAVK